MGCRKLSYYEQEALNENCKIFELGLEKTASGSIFCKDYYAGGSIMPGRSFNANAYRYGWNKGSEKDDEITGVVGSHYTTYFREFDTRLNRTWSYDPSSVAWESPYAVNRNNPIYYIDPMGDWPKWLGGKGKGGFSSSKRRYKVGQKRDNSTAKVPKPNRIKHDNSGFLAGSKPGSGQSGRFVTKRYLGNLQSSISDLQDKLNDSKDAAFQQYYRDRIAEKQRAYGSAESRTHFNFRATGDDNYDAQHVIPAFGDLSDVIFRDETGVNSYTNFMLWHNGGFVFGGSGLSPTERRIRQPRIGSLLVVHSSVTIAKRMELSRYAFGAPLRKAIEDATKAIDAFRFQFLAPFEMVTKAPTNTYQIEVNFK